MVNRQHAFLMPLNTSCFEKLAVPLKFKIPFSSQSKQTVDVTGKITYTKRSTSLNYIRISGVSTNFESGRNKAKCEYILV